MILLLKHGLTDIQVCLWAEEGSADQNLWPTDELSCRDTSFHSLPLSLFDSAGPG